MKPEIYMLYMTTLKYHYTPLDLLALRYSDRLRYEMIMLTVTERMNMKTMDVLYQAEDLTLFLEKFLVSK